MNKKEKKQPVFGAIKAKTRHKLQHALKSQKKKKTKKDKNKGRL